MEDFTQRLLDFIVKYTWHVMDEDGAPAKLSHSVIRMFDTNWVEIDMALEYLRENKAITGYSFSNQKIGLRATAKGSSWSKIRRRDTKRWLVVKGLKPSLVDHEEYVNSREDMYFMGEGDYYKVGEKSVERNRRVGKGDNDDSPSAEPTRAVEKQSSPDSRPTLNKKRNMEDWIKP